VEARGFEPRSEKGFTTASTCVVRRLRSPVAGRRTAHYRTSLLKLRRTAEDAPLNYPDIAIPVKPPRAGFLAGKARQPEGYAARAKLVLAVVNFPRGLIRIQEPEHAATASPTSSKPVAPVKKNIEIDTQSQPIRWLEIAGETISKCRSIITLACTIQRGFSRPASRRTAPGRRLPTTNRSRFPTRDKQQRQQIS
jgi:hypothetical protein